MKTHKDLDAWKNSIDLVLDIYYVTKSFPKDEMFGLVQQLRRAVVSIPSNISEGAARNQKREFVRFLRISSGSLAEVETQLFIAYKLGYTQESDFASINQQMIRIRAQINGLIKYLEKA